MFLENSKDIVVNKSCGSANSIKEVTRRILRSDGNTVKLSILTLLCILLGVLILVASSWLVVFFMGEGGESLPFADIAALASFAVLVGGFLLVFLPLVSGVICFAKRTADGERPRFAAVLEPFFCKNQKRYVQLVFLPLILALRVDVMLLPLACGIVNLWRIYTDVSGMSPFMIVADSAFVLALTVLAFAVGAYLSSYLFFVPYLVISGKAEFFDAIVRSVKMAHTRKLEITKYTLSQMPNALLSVLSFMVLWVLLAAPRMLVSYFVYCDEIENDQNNE